MAEIVSCISQSQSREILEISGLSYDYGLWFKCFKMSVLYLARIFKLTNVSAKHTPHITYDICILNCL